MQKPQKSIEMHQKRSRSQMEIAFQRLEAHMLFICPECGETYQTQQLWRQHLNYNHDYLCRKPEDFGFVEISDRYHECQTCNVMVADGKRAIALLQYHYFLHLPFSRTYRCRHCNASFTRKRVLCEHLCRNHERSIGEKLTAATVEKLSLTNTESTSKEAGKLTKVNPEFYMRYLCPQCGKPIEDYKAWIQHIKSVHSDTVHADCEMQKVSATKNYFCKICRKVFYSSDRSMLQRHYFTHMPHKVQFLCAFCKVRRAYKTELLHHFIRTHIKEFETHKKLIRKPIEWGAEANEVLSKELDLLLKINSGIGGPKGPSSMYFTSTTILNNFSGSQTMSKPAKTVSMLRKESTQTNQNRKPFQNSSSNRSLIDSKEKSKSNETMKDKDNSKTSFKNDLEALCSEIFNDIDMETDIRSQQNGNSNKSAKDSDMLNDEQASTSNTQEEIVRIEIDTLDESEFVKLEEEDRVTDRSEDTSNPAKRQKLNDSIGNQSTKYPTFKKLFNAKIVHLCPKCGKAFTDQTLWRDHVLNAHENLGKIMEESFKVLDDQDANLCLKCMQVLATTNKSELQRHCFSHMPFNSYLKCSLCGACKAHKSKMFDHLETEHYSLVQDPTKINKAGIHRTDSPLKQIEIFKGNQLPCTSLKKTGYQHLMKHLLNASDRLHRIAAGIETF